MKKLGGALAAVVVAVVAVWGLLVDGPGALDPSAPSGAVQTLDPAGSGSGGGSDAGAADHLALLAEIPVKGRAPMTGYDRDLFGQAWSDDVTVPGGRNGCDTRNDILRRDLETPTVRDGTQDCLVESGTLTDPYTGDLINFQRGDGQVEIDHVVALGDAWAKGAQQLDATTMRNLANDPVNLLAVGTSVNRQKGAGDAATWQPPQHSFRCEYAQRQIEVKHTYDLWVTAAERDALERELGRC